MTDATMLPEQLQAIDRALLTPLVRQLFRSDAVEVLDWQIGPLNFIIITPMTLGIFRVSGTALENNITKPWSLILKIVHPAAFLPEVNWKSPSSFGYMKREALAYSSSFRASLPECITMPLCF